MPRKRQIIIKRKIPSGDWESFPEIIDLIGEHIQINFSINDLKRMKNFCKKIKTDKFLVCELKISAQDKIKNAKRKK